MAFKPGIITPLFLLAILGCAPGGPGTSRNADVGAAMPATAPAAVKTITLAQLAPTKGYGPWDFSGTTGGGPMLAEVHTAGLVTNSVQGGIEPRLAEKLPSFNDGTIVILPDGRMRTVWTLRTNIKWHDGSPFTADDMVFSWQIRTHPDLAASGDSSIRESDSAEAPDPRTFGLTWKATFYRALEIGHRELWPFPKRLLIEAYDADKSTFLNQPYFTTGYVHLGPFRQVDWGFGEQSVFERFDEYFLGRPRVDRIVIRTIPDPNVVLATLHAGGIDMATERTLPTDIFQGIKREWAQTGDGTVMGRQAVWRVVWFQFDPGWGRPPEMSRDVHIRQGLARGFDRQALQEALFPGIPDASADTFVPRNDARAAVVGQPFAQYHYDPARALQDLADAGWRRGGQGQIHNAIGEPVQIEIRATAVDVKEASIIANDLRQLGLDIAEHNPSAAAYADREWRTKFPGLEIGGRGAAETPVQYLDSRKFASAENRWNGANVSHYRNPTLDGLLDRLAVAIDPRDDAQTLKEIGELLATDLPAMPMYFSVDWAAVRRGVHALIDDFAGTRGPGSGPGLISRNAHLWDKE